MQDAEPPAKKPKLDKIAPSPVMLTPCSEWVILNVGGKIFETTKSTLRSHKNCYFSKYLDEEKCSLSGDASQAGKEVLRIDRSPKYFEIILEYLRTKKVIISEGICKEVDLWNNGLIV